MKKYNGGNGTGAKPLLTIVETAAALGESERSLRTWTKAKIIPVIIIGTRTHRYKLQDVISSLEKRAV